MLADAATGMTAGAAMASCGAMLASRTLGGSAAAMRPRLGATGRGWAGCLLLLLLLLSSDATSSMAEHSLPSGCTLSAAAAKAPLAPLNALLPTADSACALSGGSDAGRPDTDDARWPKLLPVAGAWMLLLALPTKPMAL
jgi:hypothetical protein